MHVDRGVPHHLRPRIQVHWAARKRGGIGIEDTDIGKGGFGVAFGFGGGGALEGLGEFLAHGGHARVDEGFDARGSWCMRFTAPRGAPNMYCEKSLICVDPKTFLLTHLEVADEKGVFENLTFDIVDRNLIVPDAAFTPEGAGW
jgi:hypothetical protein